jgi:hypothetical protein
MGFLGDIVGGVGDFIFGSDDSAPPQAFRAPGADQQGQFLNQYTMGQMLNPQMIQQMANSGNPEMMKIAEMYSKAPGMGQAPSFTPGQNIAGQMQPTTQASSFDTSGFMPQFQQANPYQFQQFDFNMPTFDAKTAVGDAFTPQYNMAQRMTERQGGIERKGIMEDMNARGLLTTGAATEASMKQRQGEGDRLANLADQLAAQQGQAQLGATQFGAQLGTQQQQMMQQEQWQRQVAQAEEMFRQQGATAQQARDMANASIAQNQFQMGAQGQQFGQQMAGRQQGMQETQYGQQLQRLPYQDLMKLYGLSTGATPGYDYSQPGLLGSVAGGLGTGLGMGAGAALFCLPKGTEIATEEGSTKVEDINVGDIVKGGRVIAKIQKLRDQGHNFYMHEFKTGTVEMSLGHPYFDQLQSVKIVSNDSPYTYDILTTNGYYMVNGVRLGSTIEE